MPAKATSPSAQWRETPGSGAAVAMIRLYWHYDAPSAVWTLSTNPSAESGRLADSSGTGLYALMLLAAITPSMPILRAARRPAADLFY